MTSQKRPFKRSEHVYENDKLVELVKDAIRFFSGTPVHNLPPPERFLGTGVYALYYVGKHKYYDDYSVLNRLAFDFPIYVGKAVPRGWRQSRIEDTAGTQSNELHSRLREHSRNIGVDKSLKLEDFYCRFVIFEKTGSDMIGTIEAALIKLHKPLWNTVVDGFGNHTPGAGRFNQSKSDWDVIHPGREWAYKCKGVPKPSTKILGGIKNHLAALKKN